jgi:hypothetical protein
MHFGLFFKFVLLDIVTLSKKKAEKPILCGKFSLHCFLMKRCIAVLQNSEKSETSCCFPKVFVHFAFGSRNSKKGTFRKTIA